MERNKIGGGRMFPNLHITGGSEYLLQSPHYLRFDAVAPVRPRQVEALVSVRGGQVEILFLPDDRGEPCLKEGLREDRVRSPPLWNSLSPELLASPFLQRIPPF